MLCGKTNASIVCQIAALTASAAHWLCKRYKILLSIELFLDSRNFTLPSFRAFDFQRQISVSTQIPDAFTRWINTLKKTLAQHYVIYAELYNGKFSLFGVYFSPSNISLLPFFSWGKEDSRECTASETWNIQKNKMEDREAQEPAWSLCLASLSMFDREFSESCRGPSNRNGHVQNTDTDKSWETDKDLKLNCMLNAGLLGETEVQKHARDPELRLFTWVLLQN